MMRKAVAIILLLVIPSLCALAQKTAAAWTVETVPNVRLTDTRLHVSNPAGLLSAAAADTINLMFTSLERETGIEVAVVMLPSIGDADVFEFSHRLFRHWGIGKKKNSNGLLIIYVADQHAIRFVTGYGLEGVLPDAICKRIQERYMLPAFRQGDTDRGMVAGSAAVKKTLDGSMKPAADSDDNAVPIAVAAAVLFTIVIGMSWYMRGGVKKVCPKCGKRALRLQSTDRYIMNGRHYRKEIYVCRNCGHVDVQNIDTTGNDNHGDGDGLGSFLTGMLLGSLLNRGRGGGFGGGEGFSGGSFGGGDSGGGGAGSSW